ncbi:open rectifier potassium channel protein 1 [Sabethes cyaneus]|uniref:open rectifier potassium channel protein 1 n=1 Tax=Sabethes cyaneus TaxID=53552 RepID=UPI00237E829C|nr:open rectifier potassium channel protein 1 [Sabethes cyaneus]
MTPKEWLALAAFYAAYLFFGACVFYHNEHAMETERRAEELAERIEINELLTKYLVPEDTELQNELLDRLSDYCSKKVTNYTLDEYDPPYVWDFYHSFYFAFIVCSTIGYGNISPNNTFGRIFMIFYALIGLPVNGFFFAFVGEMYSRTFIKLHRRYKAYKLAFDSHYVPPQLNLIGQVVLYLIPGIVIFIFIPSSIFCYFEKWPYDVGVYYAFVTLTTIGFGDYTSTFEPSQHHEFGTIFIVYEIFVVLWFFTGVGYVFMILGFIAKGLAHKKLQRLEKIVAMNVMETQQRVWQGVTRDVSYLRKILNEVYMLKFKPVYNEPSDPYNRTNIGRSNSCPELTMYREQELDPLTLARKRACSMCVPGIELPTDRSKSIVSISSIGRRLSDTDLNRINREKTFGMQAMVQPAELLARVVTALGNMAPVDDDAQSILEQASLTAGINCFSDSQILASEKTSSGWSMNGADKHGFLSPSTMRPRASSDIGLPPHPPPTNLNDWTWSVGDNIQIKELMKARHKAQKSGDSLLRAAINNSKQYGSNHSVNVPPVRDELQSSISTTNRTLLQRLNPFRKRSSAFAGKKNPLFDVEASRPVDKYLKQTAKGRASMFNYPQQHYLANTATGRRSLFVLPTHDEQQILETTTIGDLIRALEIIHTTNATVSHNDDLPKRKIGTATPPKVPSFMNLFANPAHDAGSRRGSLRPPLSQSLSNPFPPNPLSVSSIPPSNPPPYSASATTTGYVSSPIPMRRRFSVRPSNLALPPGKCPRSASISLDTHANPLSGSSGSIHVPTTRQRRLSARLSTLANQNQNLHLVPSMIGAGAGSSLGGAPSKLKPWRPALLRSDSEQIAPPTPRARHRSLDHLQERKRTESS